MSIFHTLFKFKDCSRWRGHVLAKSTIAGAVFLASTFLLSVIFINDQYSKSSGRWAILPAREHLSASSCRSEALPRGIVQKTSDLQLRKLGSSNLAENGRFSTQRNLLAIAAGIKQKDNVNKIVQKFPMEYFTIMLLHYDGVVEQWHDLSWSHGAIHIVAMRQTKWWFAKRFLHPDIVEPYEYIFVWDEDLGVENFNASRYLKIMQEESLEISQPALDSSSSKIHHTITIRRKKARIHRRIYKDKGKLLCYHNSTTPPCTGVVEVMAPVFSRAAWKCFWHMIQNDLIQGWGLDYKLGYCAQGEQSEKVGVIDSEYIVHQAIHSLGDSIQGEEGYSKPGIETIPSNHKYIVHLARGMDHQVWDRKITKVPVTMLLKIQAVTYVRRCGNNHTMKCRCLSNAGSMRFMKINAGSILTEYIMNNLMIIDEIADNFLSLPVNLQQSH